MLNTGKKLKLSKKQQKQKQKQKQVEQANEQAFKKLQDKWKNVPSFSSRIPTPVPVKQLASRSPLTVTEQIAERLRDARATPSLKTTESQTGKALPPRYEGEMADRERLARERKHVVAPAANKMGYQLITNPEDFKTMGKRS